VERDSRSRLIPRSTLSPVCFADSDLRFSGCRDSIRAVLELESGFKSVHVIVLRVASPHPWLRVVALFVAALAVASSAWTFPIATRPLADNPGLTALPSEPAASSAPKVDSIVPPGDHGIRLAQAGSAAPTPDAAVPVGSFEGLHFGTNGPFTIRLTPPDVQVAVGPNHVVEMVNVLGRISTKTGVEVRTFPLDSFFGVPSTDFISDPKIHFDSASARWFASITDVTTGSVLLEVSKSDDPTGLWNAYSVSTITGCADQPLLGFSNLVVIISANDFSSCTGGSPSYLGVQYWVLNKTDLLSGATPRTMSYGPDPTLFSVHPVQSLRSTNTQFMVSMGSGPTSTLTLFSVTGVPPGVVLATQQNFGIRPAAIPPRAPQLGTRSTLDTADNRVQDAMWADNRLWLSLGAGCTPTGDNQVRSCVRLIEVDTANATIAQDFDIGISRKYVFYPALRTDADGNLVVVFGYSSANDYPEMRVATRSVHDPPNTIGASQVIRVGEGPETSGCPNNSVCRYGDYFGASHDPSEPGIVWVAGEYGTSTGWATFIAAMGETVRFTVGYAVQGGGSGYLPPILTYVAGGQTLAVALTTTPAVYTVDAGTAWSVSALLGGSGANERWATNESVSGVAMKSESLVFPYSHQFSASFAYRVTGGGSGYSAPSVIYEQFALARSDRANLTAWVDAGSAYAFPSSLVGSNASERWLANPLNPNGTVFGSGVIEVAYRHQAHLTFRFQGPAESSISPASGWYDVGASITPSVSPAAGWAVGTWMGTGTGAYSGPEVSPTILVAGSISEIAILYPGLTIAAGAGGSVSYSYGGISGTVAGGSTRTLYVPTGTTVMIVASPSSSYTFGQWSGISSSNRSSVNVTVTGPAQATAHFSLSASAALAYYSSIAAVGIIVALVLIAVAVRRRRRRSEPPPPPPLEPPLPPPPPP